MQPTAQRRAASRSITTKLSFHGNLAASPLFPIAGMVLGKAVERLSVDEASILLKWPLFGTKG